MYFFLCTKLFTYFPHITKHEKPYTQTYMYMYTYICISTKHSRAASNGNILTIFPVAQFYFHFKP